jgi:hypothetical protein
VEERLKPCPFCGSNAGIGERSYKTPRTSGVQHGFTANCMNPKCLAVVAGIESFDTREEAAAAWNARPTPSIDTVEKVARAICEASGQQWREGTYEVASGPNFEMEDHPLDPFNNHWRHKARAAIAAYEQATLEGGAG